jgi:magnesium transporter
MVIRGLALDEIKLKDWIRVFLKEFGIAIVVGAILSVVNGVRIFIQYKDPMLAIVIGISLVATIILSKTIGCLLPMCAKKIKLDPAIMAAPLITTIVDTCSVLVYFRIATLLLNI